MKKIINQTTALFLLFTLVLVFTSCGNKISAEGLWDYAKYCENTELGQGGKTVKVEVKAGDKSVILTIHTDKTTVGEALIEHNIIEGEQGDFGIYIKKVNGITADYNVDQSYWGFFVNGEYAMSGVETTEIDESAAYKLEYTK